MTLVDIQERLQVFSDLDFDHRRHLYFLDGVQLPSVTGLVKKFIPPFDKKKYLAICARKENITQEELSIRWDKIRDDAAGRGTEAHDFLENFSGIETPDSPQKLAGIKFLKDILEDYYVVAKELRIYSRRYKYAGTMDILLMHKETSELVICDYKTNAEYIDKETGETKSKLFRGYSMLYPPFDYLESHPYNGYQLQLSYYQIPLEEVGLQISRRLLVYLKPNGEYVNYQTENFTEDLILKMAA